MVKKSEVFVLSVLLLILVSSFVSANYPNGTSAHDILYVDSIVPLDESLEQIVVDGGLDVNGTIRGLLTPGGSTDDKVFLGLTTNLLFNAGIRHGNDVYMTVTNSGSYLPEYMNFLFDGRIDPVDPDQTPIIEDFPIIFNISFPKQYLKGDLVAGWVASDFHPTSFKFQILVYVEPCLDLPNGNFNGFCNSECDNDPNNVLCNYSSPPTILSCNPGVACDSEIDIGWIDLYSNNDYQDSSFVELFDKEDIKEDVSDTFSNMGLTFDYGTNIKIGSMRFIIYDFSGNTNLFQLAEVFFLDGLNEPYPEYYATLSGANFFGDVKIDANLNVTDSIYANSVKITESLDAGRISTDELNVEGDITASGDICADDGALCLATPIWEQVGDIGIKYVQGFVGIGKIPNFALDILGSLKISNSDGVGGLISASQDGDVLLSTDDNADIIIKLN